MIQSLNGSVAQFCNSLTLSFLAVTVYKTPKGGIPMSGYTIIDVDTHVTETPDGLLRIIGIASAVIGVVVVWFVRG